VSARAAAANFTHAPPSGTHPCALAFSMAVIDGSALIGALPKLRAYFGADLASVRWALNGCVLALASLT
jgi:hypothetical protein